MDWKIKALERAIKGQKIHRIEIAELIEQGYIRYADTVTEIKITDKGMMFQNYVNSPDYASKRQ